MEMRRRFMKEKLLTPPNICTMLRIVGTVGLLLIRPLTLPFYLLYTFCGITDVLDGTIARATNSTSEFGARLDSIADLIFYAVMIVKFFPILLEVLPVVLYRCGTGDPCLLLCYSRCAVSPVCITAYDSEQGDRFLCLLSAVYACAGFCTEVL